VALEVVDHGCGIKEQDRKDLFSPFFSRKKGGTGLGLAIVKKTVEAHGGKVLYHANPEGGITFSMRFPKS
jgi:two-component system nitrogen regulation sensor histidine kinase NtrY